MVRWSIPFASVVRPHGSGCNRIGRACGHLPHLPRERLRPSPPGEPQRQTHTERPEERCSSCIGSIPLRVAARLRRQGREGGADRPTSRGRAAARCGGSCCWASQQALAFPCSSDVRRHRGGCRCDPRPGRIRGRGRAAPAVSGHHRQRAGAGVRPHHRRLEAAAAATGEAVPRIRRVR